jgi:putative Mn2+ efflux pump MntP
LKTDIEEKWSFTFMDPITLILLALGLSADAFAVSVTNGMCAGKISRKQALLTALTFGVFQAFMPAMGYLLGQSFAELVNKVQHWIAFILLGIIGLNMIKEAYQEYKQPAACCTDYQIFTVKNLMFQGIATSIDALAAGVTFAALNNNIIVSISVIGIITFLCSLCGVYIGKKFGSLLGVRAKFIGGIILIGIGLRIFIIHNL